MNPRKVTAAATGALIAIAGLTAGAGPATAVTPPTSITRVAGFPVDVAQMPPGTGTLALPAGSVGNLVLVAVDTHDVTATGISSQNTTGWQQVTHVEDTQAPRNLSLWIGRVTTAGTDTLTVTYSGPVTSSYTEISADELTTDSLSATSWAVFDGGSKQIDSGATAVAWPALNSMAGTPQAYWGFGSGNGQDQNLSPTLGPSSPDYSGFTVTPWPAPSGNLTILSTKLTTSATYAPADNQSTAVGATDYTTTNSTAVGVIVGATQAAPGAPTNVTATAGVQSATVSFDAPASDGGTPITGYTATSNPGDLSGTVSGATPSSITVPGLIAGIPYTFTVTATNSAGVSPPSASSPAVVPAAPPPPPPTPSRVAGADRFGTAIAASQLEFPASGTAGAVVVARSDIYPDALVGTALAAAKHAPLLFANGGQVPPAIQTEIQRVLPKGGAIYVLGGLTAVPTSVATTLSGLGYTVVRYGGADRYQTALDVAQALGSPSTVLLATGWNFPDALAAGPAAAHVAGVVLLTAGSTLPDSVKAYLSAHPGKVYAVGGPAVAAYPSATPLSGADRYTTAETVAATLFASPASVGIASGAAFPDAMSGGVLTALRGGPLLLTDPAQLPGSVGRYLHFAANTIGSVYVLGGTNAISAAVETAIATAVTP